jgi:hypothetical protein
MEILLTIACVISMAVNVYLVTRLNSEKSASFSDKEIGQIKQVLNMLTWGGENENQN